MSDPRNVAHKKKVTQEKHHQDANASAKSQRGKKSPDAENRPADVASPSTTADSGKAEQHPGDLEKSQAVLSKLKDLEFHSRANIEALAQLSLTVEEELKQREFADAIGAIYSAQDAFHAKIVPLIEAYQVKCESLKPPA